MRRTRTLLYEYDNPRFSPVEEFYWVSDMEGKDGKWHFTAGDGLDYVATGILVKGIKYDPIDETYNFDDAYFARIGSIKYDDNGGEESVVLTSKSTAIKNSLGKDGWKYFDHKGENTRDSRLRSLISSLWDSLVGSGDYDGIGLDDLEPIENLRESRLIKSRFGRLREELIPGYDYGPAWFDEDGFWHSNAEMSRYEQFVCEHDFKVFKSKDIDPDLIASNIDTVLYKKDDGSTSIVFFNNKTNQMVEDPRLVFTKKSTMDKLKYIRDIMMEKAEEFRF